MAYRVGQQLGSYRLVRRLGQGAFADVYLGEHRYLKSYAALKVLRVSLSDEDVQRFLFEAQTLVRLRHANIVRVLEYVVDGGTPVLMMDYAPGGTIRQRHPPGSYLSLSSTVAYLKQVASALQYAHNHHIVHRDVKPENILLGPDQTLLLSDFGLAVFMQTAKLLHTREMAGTLPYMAPEQIQGRPSFASDQYTLGIIAYEWLCGECPFRGNQWEIINQHLTIAPPPLREKYPELPVEVEQAILKALAKDPHERFVSVQAFALALERASQVSEAAIDIDSQITEKLQPISHPPFTPDSHKTPPPDPGTLRQVFLSASPDDKEFAARLKADLNAHGVVLSNEPSENVLDIPGQEEAVRHAIRAAYLVVVVLTPNTQSSRIIKEHMRIANIYGRRMVFAWVVGEEVANLLPLPDTWGKTAIVDVFDARETAYKLALKKIVSCLEPDSETEASTLPLVPIEPQRELRNPYKGLRAFTADEASDFFGRDTLVEELAGALRSFLIAERPGLPGARLLTVIGPSGSGKSSVVMAGLLPRLRAEALTGSKQWIYLDPIVPGNWPFESLALALAPYLPEKSVKSISQDLRDDSARGLHLLATQLVKHSGARVLLIVDQLEELFAQYLPEKERQLFIDLLLTAVTEPNGSVIAVLTLRADFYDRPMRYPKLSRLIEAHHVSVLPMEIHDLRAVIEEPAAQPDVQLTFEGNLVGDLLFETQGQAGALPLLEFTLHHLFERREGHWLTQQAYREIGGVKGALAKHAESTYVSLPSEEHRTLARVLFLRLIDPGITEQDTTRRRASLAELSMPDQKQTHILSAVANAFVAARLLTTNEIAGETTIEVSHEALIREWARLAAWLRESREDTILQQAISADAADWLRRGKPEDRLYRGTQLIEAQAWAELNTANMDEVAFLQASIKESQRQTSEEQSRQARELILKRQTVNRLRALVVVLTLLLLISIVFASVAQVLLTAANNATAVAQVQAQIGSSRALAAQANYALAKGQVDKALLLSVRANQMYNTFDARDVLLSALEYSPHLVTILHEANLSVYQVMFRPDGQTLTSISSIGEGADNRGEITSWNIQTRKGQRVALDFRGVVSGISTWTLSPNGQMIAGANNQGLWLWDAQTGKRIAQLEAASQSQGLSLSETPIAFSPDNTTLASGRCTAYNPANDCIQARILLWNLATPAPVSQQLFRGSALVTQLAFSPAGKTLITSSMPLGSAQTNAAGALQVWDIASGTVTASFTGFTNALQSFVLSPDGSVLAASDGVESIYLWDAASQQLRGPPLRGKGAQILTFSPDGKTLAAGMADNTIQLWNVASGHPLGMSLLGHQASLTSLTFSPTGSTLVSSDGSGAMLVWNMGTANSFKQEISYPDQVFSATFSPDHTMIVAGNGVGEITLRDARTGNLLNILHTALSPGTQASGSDNPLAIESLAFSPDKHILAAGRHDGVIFLWNATTMQPLGHFQDGRLLQTIAFNADSRVLGASYENGSIFLWDIATGHVVHRLFHPVLNANAVSTIAFSPDGKILAYGNNNTVIFWDVAMGKSTGQSLTGNLTSIKSVVFSPNGKMVAAIDSQSMIMLWDVATMKSLLSQPLANTDPDEIVPLPSQTGLAFSPDSTLLAAGGRQSVNIWDVVQHELITHTFHILTNDSIFPHAFVRGVTFNPYTQRLLIISDTYVANYAVTLWDVSKLAWQSDACSIVNQNFTLGEWKQFVGEDTPYQKVCSAFPVDSTVAQDELKQAHADVQAQRLQDAQTIYAGAVKEEAQLYESGLSNNVCWWGSTDQFAKVVLSSCDHAVSLNPYDGQYRDSRGVARALTGNRQGAIDDFRFYVQCLQEYINAPGAAPATQILDKYLINERTGWIQQLQAGKNPFDALTLKALRVESHIDV